MTAKPEGAGLGLAISQSIVAQHGSRIRIDDAEGGGARFTISLNAAPAESPAKVLEPAV
jgi:signal transduction histidine kinase